MRKFIAGVIILSAALVCAGEPEIIPLYPDGVPSWNAPTGPERDVTTPEMNQPGGKAVIRYTDVTDPQLHVMHPAGGPSKTLVIVCPGGGFRILAWNHEGTEIAEFLNGIGVSAAVLKYRTPTFDRPVPYAVPVADIRRSLEMAAGGKLGGSFEQTGLLGFSAGGHAVAQTVFGVDPAEEVDFAVLVYPAYMLDPQDDQRLHPSLSVTPDSPPTFLAHAANDQYTCRGSTMLHGELTANKVAAEVHVFASGGHGFGGRVQNKPSDHWLELLARWMTDSGYAPESSSP